MPFVLPAEWHGAQLAQSQTGMQLQKRKIAEKPQIGARTTSLNQSPRLVKSALGARHQTRQIIEPRTIFNLLFISYLQPGNQFLTGQIKLSLLDASRPLQSSTIINIATGRQIQLKGPRSLATQNEGPPILIKYYTDRFNSICPD